MRSRTYTAGANAERDAIKAHVKRVRIRLTNNCAENFVLEPWDKLIEWLLSRDDRYNKKQRGVGK